jgi:hypothetical protein
MYTLRRLMTTTQVEYIYIYIYIYIYSMCNNKIYVQHWLRGNDASQ